MEQDRRTFRTIMRRQIALRFVHTFAGLPVTKLSRLGFNAPAYADDLRRGCVASSDLIGQSLEAGRHHEQTRAHVRVSRVQRELPHICGSVEVIRRPRSRLLFGYRHSPTALPTVIPQSILKVRAENAAARAVNLFGEHPVGKSIADFRRLPYRIKL